MECKIGYSLSGAILGVRFSHVSDSWAVTRMTSPTAVEEREPRCAICSMCGSGNSMAYLYIFRGYSGPSVDYASSDQTEFCRLGRTVNSNYDSQMDGVALK